MVANKNLNQILQRLREPDAPTQPRGLNATMRPYQLRGLGWLWFLQQLGLGACLADDMGLGKTLQVIAQLLLMKERDIKGTLLIICPASLVGNWRSECQKFAPALRVRVLHGSMASPEELATFELDANACLDDVDVVITTYLVATRSAGLKKTAWNLLVLDEAQAIKNPGVQRRLRQSKNCKPAPGSPSRERRSKIGLATSGASSTHQPRPSRRSCRLC